MTVPVILLNYNSTDDCRKCILSLQQQSGVALEIIVVDNCSTEGNRLAVEQLCKEMGCTFIANTHNGGYNAGNNVGLRYAANKGYEFALIANPDMAFPGADYIAQLAALMQEDDKRAVVASDIVTPKGIHQNPMKPDGNWRSSFGWITGLFKKQPADTYSFIDNWQESHVCKKVSGCCFMIRMSFLKEMDYFDENVFLYCEESILSKQVERAGMTMYYTADSQALHNHITTEKGNPVFRFRQWRRSRCHYIRNYSDDWFFGKLMSMLSISVYTGMLICIKRIKH